MERLQYITQGKTIDEHLYHLQKVIDGGCKWVQLRIKKYTENEVLHAAEQAMKLIENYEVQLYINDFANIAQKVGAFGVHVGLEDQSIDEIKTLFPHLKIGGTANTRTDIEQRVKEKVDYIGLGPLRMTTTKEKLSPILGFEGYSVLNLHQVQIPIFAIGGIVEEDIPKLLETGVYGIAVSGMLTHTDNVTRKIEQLNQVLWQK